MLKLGRLTKVKVLFLVLVFVFNFDLLKFSAAILEKGLLIKIKLIRILFQYYFLNFYFNSKLCSRFSFVMVLTVINKVSNF